MSFLEQDAARRQAPVAWIYGRVGLSTLLIAFLASVCFVDPIREVAKDDDWAYALTVRTLLEEGRFELHDWATCSMPAQAVWGAIFSRWLGFSFSTLRISTLVLLAVALVAFYFLLLDRGLSDPQAALLAGVLISNPLVFLLSFSFMTDVPFLSWVTITLAALDRSIRARSRSGMLLASVPASFAVLTRQFGVVLPASLGLLAFFDRRHRSLLAPALLLPTLAGLWQAWTTIHEPTLFMVHNLRRQVSFLSDAPRLAVEIPWRGIVVMQYMAMFLLPLAPLLVYAARRSLSLLVSAVVMACGACYGALAKGVLMPSVGYNLAASVNRVSGLPLVLTLLSTLLGSVLVALTVERYARWSRLTLAERFLWLTFGLLFATHMLYVDLLDEYLIPFIPILLLLLAPAFASAPRAVRLLCGAGCLAALLGSALWTFVLLERKEAFWKAAESLRARGVPAEDIYAGEWTYYHLRRFENLFDDYSPRRIERSAWLAWDPYFAPFRPGDDWTLVDRTPYRWFDFSERHVSVYRRRGTAAPP